jgi:hypothetical protein
LPEGPNLFARLHKWATRQDENFLTESLAIVLEQLLILAPEVGTRLISQLTGGFINLLSKDAASVEIRPQVEAGSGRPDLEVRVPERLVWVEVKAESELRTGQLEGYRVLLGETGVEQTWLVLLTRYPESYAPEETRPDTEIRWFEVADWLESELPAIEAAGPVADFLARQFLDFLKVRGMRLAQVGHAMPEGLRALGNLLTMLFEAAKACKVSINISAGWEQTGIKLDGRKYWVGFEYAAPEKLWFGTRCQINPEAAARLGVGELLRESGIPGDYCWWHSVELDSEEVHFFSRGKVSQMEWLQGFLRDCLAKARSIETPDQPPIPEEPEGN